MNTFRIYNVVDKKGKIVKVGSTSQSLSRRKRALPYTTGKYKECSLVLRREFDYDDKDFGFILQYVREQFEISREHTWVDEGGWNKAEPVKAFLYGFDASDAGKIGGKIRMQRPDATKHLASITKIGLSFLAKIRTTEHQRKAGKAGGLSAVKTGQIQELGRKHGPIRGQQCIESGQIYSNNHKWHIKRAIANPKCPLCQQKA